TVALSSAFPEASLIGARAVGDLRNAAIGAIILSLIIIVLYIRVRFRDFKYGIAACVALVHDVSITLGIVTVLNYVGLIHAELDLSMIAAFLTIIGYSLNDTIVVFDRIRENLELREKLGTKETFEQLIDNSVNQTLSRTVLTSGTTILVVFALFIFNYGAGSVLEGFAFSMMVGIIVGTYSSIWVANPIVLWLTDEKDLLHDGKAKPAP
ncbi:MAG: protein translocase subunit SecF, partial [Dehalococcoidia bacterium]|nr:protein translocase subunit SecF [Dehalococcoidia bacterium]